MSAGRLDALAEGLGEVRADRLGLLLHHAEPVLPEPPEDSDFRGVAHLGLRVAERPQAQLAVGAERARLAALVAARDKRGEGRRLLARLLDRDVEGRLDGAERDPDARTVGGRTDRLDVVAAGDAGHDRGGVADQAPD